MKRIYNKFKGKKSEQGEQPLNISVPETHPDYSETKQEKEERIPAQGKPIFGAAVMDEMNKKLGVEKKHEPEEANHGPYGEYLVTSLTHTLKDPSISSPSADVELISGAELKNQLGVFLSKINAAQQGLKIPNDYLPNIKQADGSKKQAMTPSELIGDCITFSGKANVAKMIKAIDDQTFYPADTLDQFYNHFILARAENMHRQECTARDVCTTFSDPENLIDLDSHTHGTHIFMSATTSPQRKATGSEDAHLISNIPDALHALSGKTMLSAALHNAAAEVKNEPSGTTACLAHVTVDTITVANIGDSRALVLSSDGTIIPLTHDHSPNDPYEAGQAAINGATLAPEVGRKQLKIDAYLGTTRSLGEHTAPQKNPVFSAIKAEMQRDDLRVSEHISTSPEISSVKYTKDPSKQQYLIIGCDGVLDQMAVNSLQANFETIFNGNDNPAEMIVRLASGSGSGDDISVIVVDLNALERPLMAGVFDGHGGKEAAKGAAIATQATLGMMVGEIQRDAINANDEVAEIKVKAEERSKGQAL